ncbi:type Z 30S ribosomal protein S14 [Candidatus Roizmanbacteria bacterium]|nr:type Z 30S ribosomal protein S14 [Candidatus Roizmanbacteria bacterium]
MAKKSDEIKFEHPQKFGVRDHNRCPLCGRSRAYIRRFGLCRICFREKALEGEIPGVKKVSW